MVIDDLILCSLQGFSPLQLFCTVARGTGTTQIPFLSRLLNPQVANLFADSLELDQNSMPLTIFTIHIASF
jgi:hypothetical protein